MRTKELRTPMTPLLLGHRGARASRQIPENSLASFELCLQHGCDGFEFDVRRSADGVAVICHDAAVGGVEIANTGSSKHSPQNGYVVSSFLPEVLTAIRELDSAIPLGFLCDTQEWLRGWRERPAEWVIPQFKLADRELIELVHAAGKKIMVWTVNRAEHMREFAGWGADAIISDETQQIAEVVSPR